LLGLVSPLLLLPLRHLKEMPASESSHELERTRASTEIPIINR
jgi:hypothetical protein